MYISTHTNTHSHTNTRSQTLTQSHTYIHSHTNTHAYIDTHTHKIIRKNNTLIFYSDDVLCTSMFKWYKHVVRMNRNKKKIIYIDIYLYIL